MSGIHTFERHVLSSAPDRDTPDRSWRAYARSGGSTVRDGEVPWVLGMARSDRAPRIGGGVAAARVLADANFDALGRAFFTSDGRLRYSLWGAVSPDPTGRWKWRIVTHTFDFDRAGFAAVAGFPEGLLRRAGPSASDWFDRFAERPFDGTDDTLSPLRVPDDPAVVETLARARLAELRRLADEAVETMGGAERVTSVLTAVLEALHEVARDEARHVIMSGFGEAVAARIVRLAWLALPAHERHRTTFSTAPLDLDAGGQAREILLVAPERWDGTAPDGSDSLSPDRVSGTDGRSGRRLWATRLVRGDGRLEALARRIEVRRLRLLAGDDLALEGHLNAWRERWWEEGPTVDLAWKLVSLESAAFRRGGRARVRAAGSALALAVLREGGGADRVARRLVDACTSAEALAPTLGRGAVRTLSRYPRVSLADDTHLPSGDATVREMARRAAGLLWCRLVRGAGGGAGARRLVGAPPPLEPMLAAPGGPREALLAGARLLLDPLRPPAVRTTAELPPEVAGPGPRPGEAAGSLVRAAVFRMAEAELHDAFDAIIGSYRSLSGETAVRAVALLDAVSAAPAIPGDRAGLLDDVALRWLLPACEQRRIPALVERLRAPGVLRSVIEREDPGLLATYLATADPGPGGLAAAIDEWLAGRPAGAAVGALADTLADTGRLSALVSRWTEAETGWPERLRLAGHPRAPSGWATAARWLRTSAAASDTTHGSLPEILHELVGRHAHRPAADRGGGHGTRFAEGDLMAALLAASLAGGLAADLDEVTLEMAATRIPAGPDWRALADAALHGSASASGRTSAAARTLARVLLRGIARDPRIGRDEGIGPDVVEALLELDWVGTRDGSAAQLVDWLPRNEPEAAPYVLIQALERNPPVSLWPALRGALAGCADGVAPEGLGRLREVAPAVYAGLRPARYLYGRES